MRTCINGHSNEEAAKFCESCGVSLAIQNGSEKESSPIEDDSNEPDTSSPDDLPSDSVDRDIRQILDPSSVSNDSVTTIASEDDNSVDDSDGVIIATTDEDSVEPTADIDNDGDGDDDDLLDPVIVDSSDRKDIDSNQTPLVPAVITPMNDVIDELSAWAHLHDLEDDPYIVGIAKAVQQRNDLAIWADIDPLDALPEPHVKTTVLVRVTQLLAVLRNVLVFLPVALTWMAISKATTAYKGWKPAVAPIEPGKFVPVEKNFLDFWSNGYGELDEFWTIPHIGMLDFQIIAVIIVLALVVSALSTRAESVQQRHIDEAERHRLDLAIKIRRGTYGKRQASPESIAESLADALNDLNQTTRDMAEVAARLERTSAGVESLTPRLEALNVSASTFANRTSVEVSNAVNSLVRSVESLNSSVNSNLTNVFESAVSNLQEAGEQLAKTSASLEYGTKLLKDDIDAIRQGLRR